MNHEVTIPTSVIQSWERRLGELLLYLPTRKQLNLKYVLDEMEDVRTRRPAHPYMRADEVMLHEEREQQSAPGRIWVCPDCNTSFTAQSSFETHRVACNS